MTHSASSDLRQTGLPAGCTIHRIVLITFFAVQIGMHARPLDALVLLRGLVRSRPIALGIPPQPARACESPAGGLVAVSDWRNSSNVTVSSAPGVSHSINLQTCWFNRQHEIVSQSKLEAVAPITRTRHFLTKTIPFKNSIEQGCPRKFFSQLIAMGCPRCRRHADRTESVFQSSEK